MIPFHKIYWWLFKSFAIWQENQIIQQFIRQWYTKIMVIKRSWFFVLWIFLTRWIVIFLLAMTSTIITWANIEIPEFKWTITFSNLIMWIIMFISSFIYLSHFKRVYANTDKIITDLNKLKSDLELWDRYFINFFNWSITNQLLLIILAIVEFSLIAINPNFSNNHVWVLLIDFFIISLQFWFLQRYRKKMIDAEMDFNVIVHWKIFLVNQSWVLSNTQTIESDKIKTIRSVFPDKISSIFNFWNIDILTEWDTTMIWSLTMNHVMNPPQVVASMQLLLWENRSIPPVLQWEEIENIEKKSQKNKWDMTSLHTMDTRWKIRDILR